MAIPERPDPEMEALMAAESLKMKASFDSPSFNQKQILEIGKFLRSLGLSSKQIETPDRRINKITAEGPGYEMLIFSGIMGQSIDVVLEDEDLVRCSWVEEKGQKDVDSDVSGIRKFQAYRQNVDLMMEKVRFMVRRRESLAEMGFEKVNRHCLVKNDDMMKSGVNHGMKEVYTKPVATLHMETLKEELQKIFEGLS